MGRDYNMEQKNSYEKLVGVCFAVGTGEVLLTDFCYTYVYE